MSSPPRCYTDAAGRLDWLRFERYAKPLVDLLASRETLTPLTVGIFGPWGSGKSTLLELIEQQIESKYEEEFVLVRFNPWVHRRESNMLVPLLHSLHDALETWKSRFAASAGKIFDVLARLGADALLKAVTFNAVDLDRLDKLEKAYIDSHKKVESEMRNLRKTLAKVAEEVGKPNGDEPGPKLVFLIDDLDRCEPDDIIDVLESVKLFLDVKNVIVVLAMDKEVIDRGIEVRYTKFKFAEDRAAALGAEYLEKIIQLPITLLPLDNRQVEQFIDELKIPATLKPYRNILTDLLLPNPRKIKRVLNNLIFAQAIMEREQIDPEPLMGQIVRLMVLQAQDGALYDKVARQPELLDALQIYYDAVAKGTDPNLTKFDERKTDLEALCKAHHRPGTYLSRLFKDRPFKFKDKPATDASGATTTGASSETTGVPSNSSRESEIPLYFTLVGA